MGKLLEAVRAKNGGALSPEQENFVAGVESAMLEELGQKTTELEERSKKSMSEALERAIGSLPKTEDGGVITVTEQIRSIGEKMDRLESVSTRRLSSAEKFNLREMLEKNKNEILAAVNSSSPSEVQITFDAARAAVMMTTQNVVTGVDVSTALGAVMDPDIVRLRYPENWILDMINSRQVTKVPPARITREQDVREGQAVVVPEGGLKPLVSYSFTDKIDKRRKIAAHMEWTEELEIDFEALLNTIIDLFERDLLLDWQDILLADIIAAAPAYVSTSLDGTIPNPNIYTAIGAGILSIQTMEFNPNVIWMNPADVWAMNLAQDTQGNPVIPPIMVGSNQIAGMRLFMSNRIEQGHALIGDKNTWREEHTSFISRIGLINDQLIHNEKTIVGEVFSLLRQATSEQGSWIYIDLAAVMAALQRPAETEAV